MSKHNGKMIRTAMTLAISMALVAGCERGDRVAHKREQSIKQHNVQSPPAHQTQPAIDDTPQPPPSPEVSAEPAPTEMPSKTLAELLAEAKKLTARKKRIAAIEIYQQVALLEPKSARPHIEMSGLYIDLREATRAREHAELAVQLEPKVSRCWNTLGRVELLQGKLPQAEKAFIEATTLNQKNIYAWNNLGLVRIKRGRYAAAASALEKATATDKPEAYMFNNLGIALERIDRIDEAIAAYKSGLALGSGVSGQNFVRLERQLELEETAEMLGRSDDEGGPDVIEPEEPLEPSES